MLGNFFDKSHSLLFGMLGAVIILFIIELFMPTPTTIATVDITRLTQQFIKEKRDNNISQEALKKEAALFGKSLEKTIKHFAEKNHLIILPKEAVMAGSQDFTRDIAIAIERSMDSENKTA